MTAAEKAKKEAQDLKKQIRAFEQPSEMTEEQLENAFEHQKEEEQAIKDKEAEDEEEPVSMHSALAKDSNQAKIDKLMNEEADDDFRPKTPFEAATAESEKLNKPQDGAFANKYETDETAEQFGAHDHERLQPFKKIEKTFEQSMKMQEEEEAAAEAENEPAEPGREHDS